MIKQEDFDFQVKTYTDEYNSLRDKLDKMGGVEKAMKLLGLKDEDVKADFMSNSDRFKKFCTSTASAMIRATATPFAYAAVISKVAEKFGVSYTAKLSTSAIESSGFSTELKDMFEQDKTKDNPHPLPLSSMFITANDTEYEYFESHTSGITHIDVVDLA